MWIQKIKLKHPDMKIRELTVGDELSDSEWQKIMKKYHVKKMNS
jgi:hypothetical protein